MSCQKADGTAVYSHVLYRDSGLGNMPCLHEILKGIQVDSGRHAAPRAQFPITLTILRKMKTVWFQGRQSYKPVMLWVAALNNFICRSGKITVLSEQS